MEIRANKKIKVRSFIVNRSNRTGSVYLSGKYWYIQPAVNPTTIATIITGDILVFFINAYSSIISPVFARASGPFGPEILRLEEVFLL